MPRTPPFPTAQWLAATWSSANVIDMAGSEANATDAHPTNAPSVSPLDAVRDGSRVRSAASDARERNANCDQPEVTAEAGDGKQAPLATKVKVETSAARASGRPMAASGRGASVGSSLTGLPR